ncbi:MAG: DUF177 domain-containing protein [Actinomycetota bacterium]|mgnify:FL=1|nr:DUF177 domain-containing protein [Actinomycetota bacterium]
MNPEKDNLRIPFAAIRRGGAKPREISITVQLDDLKVGLSKIIDGKVEVSLSLLLKGNEVEAEGFLYASWVGECRRCLEDVEGDLKLEIKERFVQEDKYLKDEETEASNKADVYFYDEVDLNLEHLIRDATLLALPLSPLCNSDCKGSKPEDFPVAENKSTSEEDQKGDPRWAVLDRLKEPRSRIN